MNVNKMAVAGMLARIDELEARNEKLEHWFNNYKTPKASMAAMSQRIEELEARESKLVDFCIWLTGCGYDFTKHDYFCQQRDKLLKGK